MTPAERILWARLRRRQLHGAYFRRQHAIGSFIVDFVCTAAKLVIEVDGEIHDKQSEYGHERDMWLIQQSGYRILRFANIQVIRDIEAATAVIAAAVRAGPLSP